LDSKNQVILAVVISILLAAALTGVGIGYFPGGVVNSVEPTSSNASSNTATNAKLEMATLNDTGCSTAVQSAPGKWSLNVSSESPALICVSFYYYNQTSTLQLNTTSQLAVFGWPTNPTGTYFSFDASRNFTIDATPASVTLGGPENKNEGVIVTYSITAVPGTSGSFDLLTDAILPSGLNCHGDFELMVGTGLPDFYRGGSCALIPTDPTSWSAYPTGFVFEYFIGITNSAG
jgi:hypothetical protein